MTIDNHCSGDDQFDHIPGSQAEAHALIALEQWALYTARLAIGRWINNSANSMPTTALPEPSLSREAWYAQAQENFQEWLGRGGFAQYDVPCTQHFAPVMADFSKPLRNSVADSGTQAADPWLD